MTTIIVRFTAPGFHRWKDAPPHRAYLGERHRHLFHVEARLTVKHDDREVEFHDLLDFCRDAFVLLTDWSCEKAARELRDAIREKWPNRKCSVSVFEDGECGALVEEG